MIQVFHFPMNYAVYFDQELPPSGGAVVSFKAGSQQGGSKGLDGPLLGIEPRGEARWLACFASGHRGSGFVDAVYATPDPDVLCVVSHGIGYWINTLTRKKDDVRAIPIRQVQATGELLMFVDFTRVACYGSQGLLWISDTLVSDRLVIARAEPASGLIECRGWDAARGEHVAVSVDLKTGKSGTARSLSF